MEIGAYLREQKQHLGRECEQVKDFSVFDFNYIPQEPVLREECRQLIQEMLRFDLSGVPNHIAIIGRRRTGGGCMQHQLTFWPDAPAPWCEFSGLEQNGAVVREPESAAACATGSLFCLRCGLPFPTELARESGPRCGERRCASCGDV